jgi:hypothetical protein
MQQEGARLIFPGEPFSMRSACGKSRLTPFCCGLFFLLAGCGYMGQPLPPALKRPERVVDLAAVERGPNIIIHFTIPKQTTEGQPIKGEPDMELRVGAAENPFQYETWKRSSDRETVPKTDRPYAEVIVPAAKWYGKTVVIGLEVHGPHGRSAGPSNFKVLPVVAALPTPEAVQAANAPDAIRLDWHAAAPEFRILRKLLEDPNWAQVATTTKPTYTDGMIEYGKTYEYLVQSIQKVGDADYAESDLSDRLTFKPEDKFAPAVPVGLSAVPGTRNIELVWDRNTEKDFASYRVYRDGVKIGEGLTAPTYSDRDVKAGVTYHYQVSAVDTAGNESAKSTAVDSALP